MKISCIQMDMRLGESDWNFARAEELVRKTANDEKSNVILLPETWNTGFFPKENLEALFAHLFTAPEALSKTIGQGGENLRRLQEAGYNIRIKPMSGLTDRQLTVTEFTKEGRGKQCN